MLIWGPRPCRRLERTLLGIIRYRSLNMSVCCLSFLSSAAEPKWNFAFLYKWPTGAEAGCIFYQPTKKFFNKTKQIWNVAFCLFSIELWIPFLNFFPSILLNYVKTKTTNKRVFLFGRLQLFFFFWKKFGNQEKKVFSILISFCPGAFANQRFVKFCSGLHFQSKLLLLQLLELFPRWCYELVTSNVNISMCP